MNTLTLLTELKEYTKTKDERIIVYLIETLDREYRDAELKKSGKGSIVQLTRRFEKILSKASEKFSKCYNQTINGEKMQILCFDGYYIIALKEKYKTNAPEFSEEENRHINFNNFLKIPDTCIKKDFDLPACKIKLSELKAESKKDKSSKDKTGTKYIYNIGETYYNLEWLVECAQCLGGDITFYQGAHCLSPSYMVSNMGMAVIMPINKK